MDHSTYGAEVVLSQSCVRETTVWGRICGKAIDTTRTPRDLRASHFLDRNKLTRPSEIYETTDLDGSNTTESPKITITYPFEFLLDFLHYTTGDMETSVGTMKGLGLKTHGSIVAIPVNQAWHFMGHEMVHTCHQSWSPCHRYPHYATQDGGEQVRKNHLAGMTR
jgi:hypothetical protein